jgi:hypothetical protein
MGKLLILTCGQIVLLVVNVICEDFSGLTVRKLYEKLLNTGCGQNADFCYYYAGLCFTPGVPHAPFLPARFKNLKNIK